jgi:uncharacterized membrane protein
MESYTYCRDGIIASYNYPIAGYFASQAAGFILALVVLAFGIVKGIMTIRRTKAIAFSSK